jgi:hypothetical protein
MVFGMYWVNSISRVSIQHRKDSLLIQDNGYLTVWIVGESDSLLFTRIEKIFAVATCLATAETHYRPGAAGLLL